MKQKKLRKRLKKTERQIEKLNTKLDHTKDKLNSLIALSATGSDAVSAARPSSEETINLPRRID